MAEADHAAKARRGAALAKAAANSARNAATAAREAGSDIASASLLAAADIADRLELELGIPILDSAAVTLSMVPCQKDEKREMALSD